MCSRSAVSLGLHRIRDVGHDGRSPLGEPARELLARLQRRVGQRLGDDPGERGPGRVDCAQHVVAHRGGLWPPFTPLGEFGERIGDGADRHAASVIGLVLGQRESRVVGRGSDRDHDAAG